MNRETVHAILMRVVQDNIVGFDLGDSLKDQVDSLSLMSIISQVEREFKIRFYTVELAGPGISSIETLTQMIVDKLSPKNADG